MSERIETSRRSLLRLGALAAAGLAGCTTGSDGADTEPGDRTTEPAGDDPSTVTDASDEDTGAMTAEDDESSTTEAPTADPDLREANVTGVEFEPRDSGYRFSVTLYHDDDGEDGYADWWQVETLDGERLGRRDLTHPHSTEPFTRSGTYEIPNDVTCVVVRGHDQTHDYGGRAMLVNLDSGAMRGVSQGSEPHDLSESECPT